MKIKACILGLVIPLLVYGLAFAAGENVARWSLNSGGNISSSPSYIIRSSVAQPVCGETAGGGYKNYSGLWPPWSSPSDVDDDQEMTAPIQFSISQNYPNPFNPSTVIEYALPKTSHVKIVVYNVLGQKVRILKDETEQSGRKAVVWDGKDDSGHEVSSGVYFYRIVAGGFAKSMKMLMVK